MLISNCCSAPLVHPDIEMCSACKEHCDGIEAECECGSSLSEEQARRDMLCDRCGYLTYKC